MTVSDELAAKSHLQAIGGVAYLASLTDTLSGGLARTMNVEHYAEQVRDKSRRRQAHAAAEHLMAATEDPSLETSECLHRIGESLLQIEADSGKTTARPIRELIPQALHELERQAANDGLVGLPTGLDSLDLGTGGIREGEMWTVGALTGRGKTAFAAQVLLANGRAGKPVCMFSLEMRELEVVKRFLAAESTIPAFQIRNPRSLAKVSWRELASAGAELLNWPIYLDGSSTLTIQELLARARLYIRRHGVKLIVVDYLRLVEAPGRELRERVGYVANALRQLAKTEDVGVVLLSQLRRPEGGMNARPTMLELKESGDIEAHSHVVLLLYMPIGENHQPTGEEEVIIGKNRNGALGPLPVYFDNKRLQFFEKAVK